MAPMAQGTVVVLGSLPVEHRALDPVVAEFGWSLREAETLAGLRALGANHRLVAVLFSPRDLDLPWNRALRSILDTAPNAFPILCHGFAETIDWPQAADAGAFHSLLLPLMMSEVRQSLGFVWDAKCRSAIAPIRRRAHQTTLVRDAATPSGLRLQLTYSSSA